jgi:fructoselysine-6-P-deglycase FrlB-like protein
MREQIAGQPAALRALLGRQNEIASIVGRIASGIKRIWAIGHGDSYFAPLAAATAFGRTRLQYDPLLAQELAAYPPPDLDDMALVIALSMSGGVSRTIDAAHAARARGARVLAITNAPDSPLTQAADGVILLGIAEPAPFLAGTVTYTASVMILMMIGALLGSGEQGGSAQTETRVADRAEALSSLEHVVTALEAAVAATEPLIREPVIALARSRLWYVLGMGCQEATARYGAAKLVEVADVIGIPHETEEFFHEHHWVMTSDDVVVIITHDEPSRSRSVAAAAHLRELGIPVWLIGGEPVDGTRHVPLGDVVPWVSPLPAAVPLQWLAYWLARAKGLDPDQRSHLRGSPRYIVSRKYR